MRKPSSDNSGQVHIIEMLTLFWLFFMSAMFIINIHVPDSNSEIIDASLSMAGRDALDLAASENAEDNLNHSSRLAELLSSDNLELACSFIEDGLASTYKSNCWVAKNSGPIEISSFNGNPVGNSVTSYVVIQDSGNIWTVSLDVWNQGGGTL
tara:strand:- start:3214 stop:3672 length:459 start_codon:yes stop_codon:yes gene_type:complete